MVKNNLPMLVLFILCYEVFSSLPDGITVTKDNPNESSTVKNVRKTKELLVPFSNRQPRTLFGILGFLTGFRLAQMMGPSTYSTTAQETSNLNHFANLFDGALILSNVKYPNSFPLETVPTSYHPLLAYSYQPYNIFPTNLQPPIQYPPVPFYNDIYTQTLQNNNNMNNNQVVTQPEGTGLTNDENKIIEALKNTSTDEINDKLLFKSNFNEIDRENLNKIAKIQEADTFSRIPGSKIEDSDESKLKPTAETFLVKSQEINVHSNDSHNTSSSAKPNSMNVTTSIPSTTSTTQKTIVPSTTTTEKTIVYSTAPTTQQTTDHSTTLSTDKTTVPSTSFTTEKTTVSSTTSTTEKITIVTVEPPAFYPYPYYYHHMNSSYYDHISITESPLTHDSFLKQHEYYDEPGYGNYIHQVDKEPSFHYEKAEEFGDELTNHFQPSDLYYDSESAYRNSKFSKQINDSGFVPMVNKIPI